MKKLDVLFPLVPTLILFLPGCPASYSPKGPQEGEKRRRFVDEYASLRKKMVETQMRDVKDEKVLEAMRKVPRHEFVPDYQKPHAYEDRPLSIGWGQTISQPYIVALMTQAARVENGDKVLEIGTGSGYQAAVLAELGCKVYTIEIIKELYEFAGKNLERTGYSKNVIQRCGDGYNGWPEEAPFDAILVTAAPEEVPEALKKQLKTGGRLVAPVGPLWAQELLVIERRKTGFKEESLIPVRFVPLVRKKGKGK